MDSFIHSIMFVEQFLYARTILSLGFPGGSVVKNLLASAGDMSLIPGLGRSPGEGSGSPFQHSCLEISWTEEAGRVPDSPCGCKRIRHDLATKQP